MGDGAARPRHLDQDFHLEFVELAAQFGSAKFVQSKQPESTLAVPDFAANERGSQPAANDIRKIAGARHEGSVDPPRPDDQVRSSFSGDAKHGPNILRQMLAVAIEGDYVIKVVVARESDTRAQGRGLTAISWQLQAGSARGPGYVRRPVAGSIVDHYYFFNMLPGALHNLRDVGGFVECGN